MKSNFIEAYNSKFSIKLLAILMILGALFIMRPRVFYVLDTKVVGGIYGDSGLYYWLASSFVRNFFENSFFQTSMYYPYGYTLAWSDNFILPSVFINILNVFFSFNTSYNLCFLITWVLNGFSVFLLLYFLTGSKIYSILPAVLFSVNSSLAYSMGHPQLQFIFFIPFGILYFFKFLLYENKRYAFYLGFSIFLSFITTVYYAVFLCLSVFFLYVSVVLLKPRRVFSVKHISNFLKGFLCGIFPICFFLIPYLQVKKTFGIRALYEPYAFASTLLSYFSSSSLSVLYDKFKFSHSEGLSFVGFVPLLALFFSVYTVSKKSSLLKKYIIYFSLLFLTGSVLTVFITSQNYVSYVASIFLWIGYIFLIFIMIKLRKLEYNDNFYILSDRGLVLIFLFLLTSIVFLSYGPLGSEVTRSFPSGLYYVMYHVFPGVNAIRAIGRLGLVTILIMYVLFAINFYLLFRNKKIASVIFILLCGFNFFEQKVKTFQIGNPPNSKIYKNIDENLNDISSRYSVIYLPMQNYKHRNKDIGYANYSVSYMLNSLSHNHAIINGYSGQRGRVSKEYPDKMKNFPDERSINTIAWNYNLKYVVYDGNKIDGFDALSFEKKIDIFKTRLKIVAKDNNVYLIEYIGSFKNRKSYNLTVPKYYKKIKIQIKTKNSPREKDDRIIMVKNSNNDTFVASILPNVDDNWYEYTIDLSRAFCDNYVSPYRLSFSSISDSQQIYIKSYE